MSTNAQRVAAWRDRRKAEGLKTVTVVAPEKDEEKLKRYAKRLVRKHKNGNRS